MYSRPAGKREPGIRQIFLEHCVVPVGDVPDLESGANEVEFACEAEAGRNPRAYVSVITQGEPFGGANPPGEIRAEFLQRIRTP